MIDLEQNLILKLIPIPASKIIPALENFLLESEKIHFCFKIHRDQVIFTSKRIIFASVQGLTGKKIEYTSISYTIIQVFSIGNSGSLERDCELEIHTGPFDVIRFEIRGSFDILALNNLISKKVLG